MANNRKENIKDAPPRSIHINKVIVVLIFVFVAIEGLIVLNNYGFIALQKSYLRYLKLFIVMISSLLTVNIVLKFTENRVFRFFKDEVEIEQRIFITKLYKMFLYGAAFTVILSQMGLTIQNITIFLGLITTGIALALRDMLMSYFVWLVILLKKPFRIGDYIRFGDDSGKIVRIGTYFITMSVKSDGKELVIKIPNKILLDKPIINYGSDNVIIETVAVPLSHVPAGIEVKIAEIKKSILKILGSDKSPQVYTEIKDLQPRVVATYSVRAKEKYEVQTKIAVILYASCRGFVKK